MAHDTRAHGLNVTDPWKIEVAGTNEPCIFSNPGLKLRVKAPSFNRSGRIGLIRMKATHDASRPAGRTAADTAALNKQSAKAAFRKSKQDC
jgi:hypothetical protein